jgi:hypothetical protein
MSVNGGSVGAAMATVARAAIAILVAVIVMSAAIWLAQLQWRVGPAAQPVNIRWVANTAANADARLRAQDALRLTGGKQLDARTWSYRLADRSPEAIGRIIADPSVDDTHRLDRVRRRVAIDQPTLPVWLRELLEAEWALPLALVLMLVAAAPLWITRRAIAAAPGEVWHLSSTAYGATQSAAHAIATRTRAVVVMPSTGVEPRAVPELQWMEVAAGLAMGLLLLAPLLANGPTDDEEVGLGVFSSQIFYRALFNGHWPFWLNDLGFGTPMPIGQRLDFHPVFAIASVWSLWAALTTVWVVHVALMVVYFLRLLVLSGIRSPLRLVLLGCYVFSMPAVCYFYQTDWISVIVGWTWFPVVVFYLHSAVRDVNNDAFWAPAMRLGLVVGVWVLNAHPGYLATLAIGLGVYGLALAPRRIRVYSCLLLAVMLAGGLSAERIEFTMSELRAFPSTLGRLTQGGFTIAQHAQAAVVPLAEMPSGLRGPFVGIVLGLAAFGLALNTTRERDRHVRASGIAFVVTAALSIAPLSLVAPLRVFSAVWLFRDPMIFFAILAGGVWLQRAVDTFRPAWKMAIVCCVMMQVVQQGIAVWPGLLSVVQQSRSLDFYRHQYHAVGIGEVITQRAASYGSRLYISEEVLERMRGQLSRDGLHSVTDLVFLGVNPVNASFKTVSMDQIYPSRALMRSMIGGQLDVIDNETALDVLGVNLVVMAAGEGPAPPTLHQTDLLQLKGVGRYEGPAHDIRVLANEDAWPTAVLTDIRARTLPLPFRPGCPHRGALCRDFSGLAGARLPVPVRLDTENGRYTARFPPSDQERLLFLSVLSRPEWHATAGTTSLRIVPIADAFVGVVVAPGVEEIELRYAPRVRIALAWFSGAILIMLIIAVGLKEASDRWRHNRRARV